MDAIVTMARAYLVDKGFTQDSEAWWHKPACICTMRGDKTVMDPDCQRSIVDIVHKELGLSRVNVYAALDTIKQDWVRSCAN